ncbi:hypothetical protein ACFTXB_03890 [Streptomyces sp. NPDC057074]|uniref:hypothetical protein n=1 Tax=Streptomyces sp. NPDC057074 TaxID=3346015 RepID=UPI0036257B91
MDTHHGQHVVGSGLPGSVWLSLAAFLAITVMAALLGRRGRIGRRTSAVGVALAVLGGAAVIRPAVLDDVMASHIGMMPALMTATFAAPALFVRCLLPNGGLPRAALPAVGLLSGAVLGAVTVLWHLPAFHVRLMGGSTLSPLVLLLGGIAGAAFWLVVLDPHEATSSWRRRTVLLYGVPSGLLGLAVLLAPAPIHPELGAVWLGPMADQRVGGLLMMFADLLLLVPVLPAAVRKVNRSASLRPTPVRG